MTLTNTRRQFLQSAAVLAGAVAWPKWMPRLAFEDRLQDRRAFELICIGLVVGGSRNVECDGVENLRFMIFRIFRREFSHSIAVRNQTRVLSRALEMLVQVGDCGDVGAFALRLDSYRFTPFGALSARL